MARRPIRRWAIGNPLYFPPMLVQMQEIFAGIILPILVLAVMGVVLQRFRPMDIPTLAKLNIYLLVPAFLFVNVSESTLTWRQIGGIAAGVLLPSLIVGVIIYLIARSRRLTGPTIGAMVLGAVIFNAGNFGVALAILLYPDTAPPPFLNMNKPADGRAVQALILMMSNFSIWCFGFIIISLAKGHGLRQALLNYFKLPLFYVLIAALVAREFYVAGHELPTPVMFPLKQLGLAIIPVAMITLGAQLANRARMPHWRRVGPIVAVKLLAFPMVTGLVVWVLGLWPWPGVQIVIASAAPTAVNTLLVTVELDGDADLAADCVLATTVLCAVSVTFVIVLMKMIAGTSGKVWLFAQ